MSVEDAAQIFLSTPSARRATHVYKVDNRFHIPISIHALREEGDLFFDVPMLKTIDFYPRPPRGGRRDNGGVVLVSVGFLSTPSARRATPVPEMPCSLSARFLSTPSARRATGSSR